jgi:hypothetical protein
MNIKYIILGIVIVVIIFFTNIIAIGKTGLIIQFPQIQFFPEFLNSMFFVEIIMLSFLFLMPYILVMNGKKRGKR